MRRRPDQHIDSEELNALVRSGAERLPAADIEVQQHLDSCAHCRGKVADYSRLLRRLSVRDSYPSSGKIGVCATGQDVNWRELSAGLWPELRTKQLIVHAAMCDQCGPLLRAATSSKRRPVQNEMMTSLPGPTGRTASSEFWPLKQWLIPAVLFLIVIGALGVFRAQRHTRLSGPELAEFATNTQRQYAEGHLPLSFVSGSQQAINLWFKGQLDFPMALPASSPVPGETRPYKVEGARLLEVSGRKAAFIAYKMQSGPASLIVTPATLVIASGGAEAHFEKVTFHYSSIRGYKVVTWSQHGLTYALVSQEGNKTQKSCMVCHSSMKDRDLSQTPTPLRD